MSQNPYQSPKTEGHNEESVWKKIRHTSFLIFIISIISLIGGIWILGKRFASAAENSSSNLSQIHQNHLQILAGIITAITISGLTCFVSAIIVSLRKT